MMIEPITVPARLNLPPAMFVPPMTTARMASISKLMPKLLESFDITRLAVIRPAIAERKAVRAKTIIMILRESMPLKRLALGLMPTDSTIVPKAVFRTNTATAATTTAVMMIGMGRNRKLPCPITRKGEYSVVNCLPLVTIWAMPRPHTMRISVAMIGCMPIREIIKPLKRPISVHTASGTRITRIKGLTV